MRSIEKCMDARARRAARRAGLLLWKSRCQLGPENAGDYMLVEPSTGIPVAGFRYDMTAEEVIDYCRA